MTATSPRILIVEDEASYRELVVFLFHRFHPHVQLLEATNGQEGYDLYQQYGADLIITDDQMPVMRGTTLLHTLRSQGITTPAVLLSSLPESHIVVADDAHTVFAAKPVLMDNLLAIIDALLASSTT